jgi:hypothetical protein
MSNRTNQVFSRCASCVLHAPKAPEVPKIPWLRDFLEGKHTALGALPARLNPLTVGQMGRLAELGGYRLGYHPENGFRGS